MEPQDKTEIEVLGVGVPGYRHASIAFLFDSAWWRQALRTSLEYARFCIPAAALLVAGHLVLIAATLPLQQPGLVMASVDTLIRILIVGLIGLVAGVSMSLIALAMWLDRLTAFARCLLAGPGALTVDSVKQARFLLSRNKGKLARLWLTGSIIVLASLVPLSVLIALNLLASPEMSMYGVPAPALPPLLHYFLVFVLSVITFGYLLTLLAYSSVSSLPPAMTALCALKECLLSAPKVVAVTSVVLVLNMLISTPYALMVGTGIPDLVRTDFQLAVASQLWFGLTITVVWPLSVAPYCQMTGLNEGERN